MHPFQARTLRWMGYLFVALGLLSAVFGIVGVGIAIVGPANQRVNAVGDMTLGFGGGFANTLLGGGLLMAARAERR